MTATASKPRIKKSPAPKSTTKTATPAGGDVKRVDKPSVIGIPEQRFLTEYIQRQLVPGITEFDAFDLGLKMRGNILIEGPTGPGKTSAVLAYAAKKGAYFYSVSSNVAIDPTQMFGKMIPSTRPGVLAHWQDGGVTELVRKSQEPDTLCVLLINEVNFMPDKIATVLFGLLDKRREIVLMENDGEVVRAGRGAEFGEGELLIIADMNPDYEGTRPLNKAFRNRFAMQFVWDYDPTVESKLVRSGSLRSMATKFRRDHAQGLYDTPVSTNMLQEFVRHFDEAGWEFARFCFVNHFPSHERDAAVKVLDTHEQNIKTDLLPEDKKPKPDPEPKKSEKPSVGDDEYQPDESREWKIGDVDPRLGIYGVDWEFDS